MLNDTLIRSLKFTGKPKKHFDGGGMFLLVTATGSKFGEQFIICHYHIEFYTLNTVKNIYYPYDYPQIIFWMLSGCFARPERRGSKEKN